MAAAAEHIEHIALSELVLGENPRTVRPSPQRIEEYARSIAHFGILVPLIAERVDGRCHLRAGYTRVAALRHIADDRLLRELAEKNGVDIHHVPIRFFTGDDQRRLLLPIVENNFHDLMNEVDVANRVKLLLDNGTDRAMLKHFFGHAPFARFPLLLALPPEVQQWIKEGRLKPTTALKFAKKYLKPATLIKKLRKVLGKVDDLIAHGRRTLPRVTEGIFSGRQTPARVMNELCSCLHKEQWKGSHYATHPADVAFTIVHGVQRGMRSAEIMEVLHHGGTIEQPPVKKRGRKPKKPQ